jgi:hypothetical protein
MIIDRYNDFQKKTVYTKLFGTIMNENITVGCVTCHTLFLNMKWRDYLPLLHGDYNTSTKWYNKVVLHYCENPTHIILSNRSRTGINQMFDFTKALLEQCQANWLPLYELHKVALEMEKKVEGLPI